MCKLTCHNFCSQRKDFAKVEAGKIELEKTPADFSQCIETTLSLVQSKANSKKIQLLHTVGDSVPPTILCDAARLRQVLINLVSNALKFTDVGFVSVHASVQEVIDERQVKFLVQVRDTGIGIPAAKMDKLFQSFSQVDASTSRKYGGTGLGLAICRRLVNLMGGEIWCNSVEGEGSVFSFTFFAQICNEPRMKREAKPLQTDLGERHPLRILLAEDNCMYIKMGLGLSLDRL